MGKCFSPKDIGRLSAIEKLDEMVIKHDNLTSDASIHGVSLGEHASENCSYVALLMEFYYITDILVVSVLNAIKDIENGINSKI